MKAQITSSGNPITPVHGVGRKAVSQKPSEADNTPSDVFLSGAVAVPSQESRDGEKPVENTPTSAPAAKPETSPQTKAENNPGLLTVLDEPTIDETEEPKKGLTLAEIARSASVAIGQGLRSVLVGDQLKPFKADLDSINSLKEQAAGLKTPEQFAAKTAEFKARLAAGESMDKLRPEAYAVAREAAKQATGMFAYDCQVLGALAMDDGHIAEMRTGEGKTLTAVLPLYLNALAGKGAHLVTVNETLAKRDSEWMGPIFQKLGMTVGCVTEDQNAEQKRAGYDCDVTYVSDRALGFDFLRDRGAMDPAERVQRKPFFALIDEVDEVLIDEARTPMILSGPSGPPSPDYKVFSKIVKDLVPGEDFKMEEEKQTVWLTDGGLRFVENELLLAQSKEALAKAAPGSPEALQAKKNLDGATLLRGAIRRENAAQKKFDDVDAQKPNPIARAIGMNGKYDKEAASKAEAALKVAGKLRESLADKVDTIDLYSDDNVERVHYLDACLKANTLYSLGKNYTVENGEVKIVDQNKGRVSDGKRYSNGLHQALEAKEGLEVKSESITVSKITMPELIAQYERKAGMTGTGKTSEGEFQEFYGLDVLEIPTNKPVIRVDHPDVVFATKEAKYQKVVAEAVRSAQEGRPVLVGTVSVNSNREVAARLLNAGWPPDKIQILNAETVKGGEDFNDPNAGRSGTITLATGDRAKDVKPDPFNYKKMAFTAHEAASQGKPVLIDTDSKEDAEQVKAWLEGSVPVTLTDKPGAQTEGVQLRVRKPGEEAATPNGVVHVDARDFAVEKPLRFTVTEENLKEVLPRALEAFNEGTPVVLAARTTQQMGQSAEFLLDRGLGLEAIPMVCDGKQKENVMIEMAGRSGVITVATNMAGRGADIKPDLVATTKLAEAAYEKASNGKPVTISVKKESQAVKLQRLMQDFVPISIADQKSAPPKDGEILIRVEKEPHKPATGEFFKGDDFATGGLYVIGTERAYSRRVDDQLIGRAGRQGAEGDSRFFLSLEDDVPRIFGGENFEPLLNLFGDSRQGVSKEFVNSVMDKAQTRVENQHFEQRQNAAKYDEVHKMQRETFYKLREGVLTGEDDAADFAADYAAQGLATLVREELGEKGKYTGGEINEALKSITKNLEMPDPFSVEGKIKADDLAELLYPQVEKIFKNEHVSQSKLRGAVLGSMDLSWQTHLEEMDALRDGIHLEAMSGREPEQVYGERGFELFSEMISGLKRRVAQNLLPAAARLVEPSTPGTSGSNSV